MSEAHSHAEIQKHKKIYMLIFGALLVGTFITVWLNSIHFESFTVTVAIALLVATVKALLVAGFFMHLISEKKAIYSTLAITCFFAAAMMVIFIWSREALPTGADYFATKYTPLPMTAPAK
jgi:cytochrome c oxidase subunit IV